MEPVTHVLTGACLSRTGFNRRVAYATLTMAAAAEMPDIDTVWSWLGPVEGFAHHRGITHTFVALPIEAGILVGAIYGLHRWRRGRANSTRIEANYSTRPLTLAPVRWWALYGCALIGLLSHLLLDYTNNYGLRPFYPFNPHWYAASIAFIFDPVIFLLLAFALILPSIFGLVSAEVGAKARPFRGSGLAIGALLCIAAWWGLRFVEHEKAVALGMQQTYDLQQLPFDVVVPLSVPSSSSDPLVAADGTSSAAAVPATPQTELVQPPPQLLQAQRVQASPNPLDPFRWAVTIDYGPLYQLANIDARTGNVTLSDVTYPKLANDAAMHEAESSPLGRVYLDWSTMPIVTEDAPVAGSSGRFTRRVVLRDPRFMGDISWLRLSQTTPLTAVVTVDDGGHVVRESLDGRREQPGRAPIYEAHIALPNIVSSIRSSLLSSLKSGNKSAPKVSPAPATALPIQHVAILPNLDLPVRESATASMPPPVASAATPAMTASASPRPASPVPQPPPGAEAAKTVVRPTLVPPAPLVSNAAKPPATGPPAQGQTVGTLEPQLPQPTSAAPPSTAPGFLEVAKSKAKRFRNWLHWLANGD